MQHVSFPGRCLTRPIFQITLRTVQQQKCSRRHLLTLAIETSCDDTCVAILEKRPPLDNLESQPHDTNLPSEHEENSRINRTPIAQLHFNEKVTSNNKKWGGIHPIESLESHQAHLSKLLDKALLSLPLSQNLGDHGKNVVCRDGSVRTKPDFVSVTRGPGMKGNLAVGLETAKGLAVAWQIPLLGVHHMQAHALTPRLIYAMGESENGAACQPAFPFLTLLVSGGHTMLVHSTGLTEHRTLGTTGDVAIGDALDKCGRLLLPEEIKQRASDIAFGKYLSQYAFPDRATYRLWPVPRRRHDEMDKPPNQFGWQLQSPLSDTRRIAFSFAAFESLTENLLAKRLELLGKPISSEENRLLARTVIGTAFEHLSSRTVIALEELKSKGVQIQNLVVSGGVAANDFLRYYLRAFLDIRGFENVNLIFPPVEYCTDNAAMIAWTGMEMYKAGYSSDVGIASIRKWSMDSTTEDGGILGIGGWVRSAAQPTCS